jgi:hypothetical protein
MLRSSSKGMRSFLPNEGGHGAQIPACINLKWPLHLPFVVRQHLLCAIVKCLLSIDGKSWDRLFTTWMVQQLDRVRTEETNERLSADACVALHGLLHSGMKPALLADDQQALTRLCCDVDGRYPQESQCASSEMRVLTAPLRSSWYEGE